MTSGRFWRCAAAATALLVAGCSNVSPCGANCPAIEGTYTLDFAAVDGGLGADCEALSVELPKGPLAISRNGSDLGATLDAFVLNGTVYATNDFTLAGGRAASGDGGTPGETANITLTGSYTPPPGGGTGVGDAGTSRDGGTPSGTGAGARLSGTFFGTWSTSGQAARRCTLNRPFTGTRQ